MPSFSLQLHATPDALARRMAQAVTARGLITQGDAILVSVSGGPDSVALLAVLTALAPRFQLTVQVVHFNHGLRGAESDEDERFVAALCERMNVPYRSRQVHLPVSERAGRSLQEMARDARYAALCELAVELKVHKVALGHTADDQAETVLMWMLRGAGTSGLAGMPASRAPFFIRPLLDIGRAEVLAYLTERQLPFRTDSSNATSVYLRNRIRHELLPVLRRLSPRAIALLGRQAEILREDDRCLEAWTSDQLIRLVRQRGEGTWDLERDAFLALPLAIQRRLLRQLLRQAAGNCKGPDFRSIATVLNRVLRGASGRAQVINGVRVVGLPTIIRFENLPHHGQSEGSSRPDRNDPGIAISVPSELPSQVLWPLTRQALSFSVDTVIGQPPGSHARSVAVLDADRFTMALQLRTWRPGDVFQPAGMHGRRKKLKEFFIDRKVPRESRRQVPLLVAPEGILWVAGYRTDERFRVTASTRKQLIVRLIDAPHVGAKAP